jgi:hypothetical protein
MAVGSSGEVSGIFGAGLVEAQPTVDLSHDVPAIFCQFTVQSFRRERSVVVSDRHCTWMGHWRAALNSSIKTKGNDMNMFFELQALLPKTSGFALDRFGKASQETKNYNLPNSQGIAFVTSTSRSIPPAASPSRTQSSARHQSP